MAPRLPTSNSRCTFRGTDCQEHSMFIGHFAVGFAVKRAAPRSSLGVLIAAPIFLDLLWPIFLLLGWERVRIVPGKTPYLRLQFVSYPISHSLLTSVGWGLLFALVYWTL